MTKIVCNGFSFFKNGEKAKTYQGKKRNQKNKHLTVNLKPRNEEWMKTSTKMKM